MRPGQNHVSTRAETLSCTLRCMRTSCHMEIASIVLLGCIIAKIGLRVDPELPCICRCSFSAAYTLQLGHPETIIHAQNMMIPTLIYKMPRSLRFFKPNSRLLTHLNPSPSLPIAIIHKISNQIMHFQFHHCSHPVRG